MTKKVTLSDVAAAAGVSAATASRALGSAGRVSAATRERVLATAARLDFQPDALARSFVTGKSATVGVLAESARGLYSMPVIIGAIEYLGAHGIATLMHDAHATTHELVAHLKRLKARRVDGLLVIGDGPDLSDIADAIEFPAPMVFAYAEPSPAKAILITPDQRSAGVTAAEHLIGAGRRKIAHITAAATYYAVQHRAAGLADTMAEHDLALAGGTPWYGTYSRAWGAEAAALILEAGHHVDAIFAADDEIAIGAYTTLTDHGLRVPDDIAIVGYDNQLGNVQADVALLTTIDPRLRQIGAQAAEALLDAIGGESPPGTQFVPGHLIVGRSTIGPTLRPHLDIAP